MKKDMGAVMSALVAACLFCLLLAAAQRQSQQEQQQETLSEIRSAGDNQLPDEAFVDENNAYKRRLMESLDPDVLARYQADPKGFRRHPSYYSDTYLPRAVRQDDSHGSWNLVDLQRSQRPGDDFYAQFPNRDVPWTEFPDTAWQKDAAYLPQFLDQGLALVERAMEAILEEYGLGADRDARPFEERIKRLGPMANTKAEFGTFVPTSKDSFQGLVRRILHAIVTEDTFHLAMAGHSAAAGHGNHFQQSFTHAYGAIMEPIFARLGVFATSRNFGFGGLGTIQTGMASADLMGPDVDMIMWDSGMTEKNSPAVTILGIQAALGGDRVPFFMTENGGSKFVKELSEFTGMDGCHGPFQEKSLVVKTDTVEELEALPWAAKCLSYGSDLKSICGETRTAAHAGLTAAISNGVE